MNFGNNLMNLRKSKELSREQLAKYIIVDGKSISHETIKKYETNEREPKFIIIKQFTEIFNCDFNELFK